MSYRDPRLESIENPLLLSLCQAFYRIYKILVDGQELIQDFLDGKFGADLACMCDYSRCSRGGIGVLSGAVMGIKHMIHYVCFLECRKIFGPKLGTLCSK